MKNTMYNTLINRIVRDTKYNLMNADDLDVVRSAVTRGSVSASIQALQDLGYEANYGDWEDRGCLRIGFVKIAGTVIVKNSTIDYDAVAKLLRGCPASTEEVLESSRIEVAENIERSSSREAKLAWYFTHCGEIEMCRFLGLISEDRRAELEAEWKKLHP